MPRHTLIKSSHNAWSVHSAIFRPSVLGELVKVSLLLTSINRKQLKQSMAQSTSKGFATRFVLILLLVIKDASTMTWQGTWKASLHFCYNIKPLHSRGDNRSRAAVCVLWPLKHWSTLTSNSFKKRKRGLRFGISNTTVRNRTERPQKRMSYGKRK